MTEVINYLYQILKATRIPNLDKPEKNDPQISQIDADKNIQSAKSVDNFLYMVQEYH